MTAASIQGLCPLIQVFDMPTSLAFYRNVLGFEAVQQSSPGDDCDWVWLRLGGADLMLNTRYEADDRPSAPDRERVAAHDDTCFYLRTPDVDEIYERLRNKGVELAKPTIAPYGMKQLYLKDPDGFGLCFQWPAP